MLSEEMEKIIRPILEESEFDLIELKIKGTGKAPVFQIFVDHDQGVKIADCSRLSRCIATAIDCDHPEIQNYRLEVSSPGLDRPLKTERDFEKNVGRDVKVVYGGEEVIELTGTLESVREGDIRLKTQSETHSIPIRLIRSARIKLKW